MQMQLPMVSTPSPLPTTNEVEAKKKSLVFDSSILQNEHNIPIEFIWPDEEKPSLQPPEKIQVPIIDIGHCFNSNDETAMSDAVRLIDEACKKHGFFLVVNHGVDPNLVNKACEYSDYFFGMPLSEKQRAQRKVGESYGYASSITGRFNSKLPWKETLSFRYTPTDGDSSNVVEDYFSKVMGNEFREAGKVYQEYCASMDILSLQIMELLGMSLGVGRDYFRNFYKGNDSMLRLNYYPRCQKPELTLGTGPHSDSTSLTILHQDDVGGLEVFVDKKWHSVDPIIGTFVVNIGDTFMALTNGIYKSGLHRAVVNNRCVRKSMAFFLNSEWDKVVRAPNEFVNEERPRAYPNFTWRIFLEFTQKHYRSDTNTLDAFSMWLRKKADLAN